MARGSEITLTIFATLILTVLLIATVNFGTSIVLERPEYRDFCEDELFKVPEDRGELDQQELQICNQEFSEADAEYNQIRFYIFAGIGLVLVLLGLFVPVSFITWTGLLSGLVLLTEGIVFNIENKIAVTITLIIILVLIGIGAWRALKKFR